MPRITRIVLAAFVVAIVPLAQLASAGGAHKNSVRFKSESVSKPCYEGDGDLAGTVTYIGPLKLWPPNHKYETVSVVITDEDNSVDNTSAKPTTFDNVTLVTEATHDQYDGDTGAEANGSGNTADDITPAEQHTLNGNGSATQQFQVRAERSGRFKEGRTYTISYEATFSDSDGDDSSDDATVCTDSFAIVVPHDMRPSNR